MDRRILYPDASDCGLRLDVFLADELSVSRSQAASLIRSGAASVGGKAVKCGYTVKESDEIIVELVHQSTDILPEDIPLDILYEDSSIAVINKPQGMSVHPGGGVISGTLANALLFRYGALSSVGGAERPGIVHRLDKDTSGVMVAALTDRAHAALSGQFAARETKKFYHAILEGNLANDNGEIKTLIGRDPKNRKLMTVTARDGREAITRYRVLERYKNNCYVEFQILTGRTHQIRVHAKELRHPVVGDAAYGYKKQRFRLAGQLLHAKSLTVRHPDTQEEITFTAPLSSEFERILTIIRSETR